MSRRPRTVVPTACAVITLVLAGLGGAPLRAQTPSPLPLTRLTAAVTLDGVPDEPAWRDVPPLPLTMYTPTFRGSTTQRSEIRVAYDDDSFYAAGWFYDTDPRGIRINSLYRDRWNGDDAFAIYIDAFNDNQNAKWFGITAGGMRFDQLVSDDGATLNGTWDTFWAAKTTLTAAGWFVEVRIPFSSIGFRVDAEHRAVMGLTVTRLISRLNERVTFPAIDPRFEFRRPSVAQDVELRDVHAERPLYLTPYALTGVARSTTASTPSGFHTDRNTSREVGVDLRYPLSSRLTLDLTANTDFAQVEADDQQVNLDRFPLLYPERRRFFQEGSGIFDYPMGGGALLFHSRRVGLTPTGAPIPVLGGARLVGRVGAWDLGLLEMQTGHEGTFASENFGVLRLRRPVLNPWSTAGMMLTSVVGAGGDRRNHVLAGDATLRVHGDHYVAAKWATSFERGDSTGAALFDRSQYDLRVDRRTERGLAYSVSLTRSGSDYRPELGFMPRRDFTTNNWLANWFFFTDSSTLLRRVYPGALAFSTYRHADGALESGQYAVWVEWDTKAGGGGWIEPKVFHEDVVAPFRIGGVVDIPAGRYDFADLQLALIMASGKRVRTSLDLRSGTYFDGTRTQAILKPTWNVSPHLELGADYRVTALRFADRDQSATLQVVNLRVGAAIDARKSGNALLQYNSTTNRLDCNLRLRYALAEGTDFWLVYNEGLDTDRGRDPIGARSPLSLARTLIVKYTHTFAF